MEDDEDILMTASAKSKRKSRAAPSDRDVEMPEASFPVMPTPATSFGGDMLENMSHGLRQESVAASRYIRSQAPSVETGLHMMGRRVQVLVDAIHDFREFGVEHVISLPELVLVGDQSAGKSSLMGALAEIHLPQSAGCCTRCPAHIKTAPAETWSCKVSLEQTYAYEPVNGRPLDSKDVTRNRPFPPWKELPSSDIKPFKTIHNKRELEEVLRWAQIATLNHNKHHAQYIPGTDNFIDNPETEAKFSPNVVSVEISGPGLVPLSFYDLPGIFQNAGQKEDQYLVKVIENLAMKYIRHPQALIICALPMSADPATSRTAKVISDLNAESRCIGVLTKADQLQDGQTHVDFEAMLQGREHVVRHGYFVTKLPGQSLVGAYDEEYHAKASIAEARFFASQGPWDKEWSGFQSRFGTRNLAHALSQKFAAQIVDSIPEIEHKINQRALEIEGHLMDLPELPSQNILHVVLQNLSAFSSRVGCLLDGAQGHNELQSSWQVLCRHFCDAILAMRPRITIVDDSDWVTPEVISIDDDDKSISSEAASRKRANDETPTREEKKAKVENSNSGNIRPNPFQAPRTPGRNGQRLPHRAATPRTSSPMQTRNGGNENPFSEFMTAGKNFASIADIRDRINKHSRTGVPGIVSEQVHMDMCLQSVTPWELPLELMLDITFQMLRQETEAILFEILSKWQQTQLFKRAREHLATLFDDLEASQRAAAMTLYEIESYKLFTINTVAMDEYRRQELEVLKKARRARRAKAYLEKQVTMKLRQPFRDEAAKKKAIQDLKDEVLDKDPFETEIEVAAWVRGYYKTAALRFVDQVCLSINGKLFRQAKFKISYFLEHELGLDRGDGEQRCRELMEENTAVAARRADLKKEKKSLVGFTERLQKLARDNAALDKDEPDANAI